MKFFRYIAKISNNFASGIYSHLQAVGIGFYLAHRQVRRSSKWTTALIIFVMTLTFLNLVVISGILVGLVEGVSQAVRDQYMADLLITPLNTKKYIENSPAILATAKNLPGVLAVTPRYSSSVTIETDYKTKIKASDKGDSASTIGKGIDPIAEDEVTHISKNLVEGEYLKPDDYDKILVGSLLLKRYFDLESPGFSTLKGAQVGDKVRIEVASTHGTGTIAREMTVKGVIKTKVDDVSRSIFFVGSQFRSLIGRDDYNVNEMAIKIKPGVSAVTIKDALIKSGFDQYAKIQTYDDAEPKFVKDLKNTFALLGNVVGSIGLIVASITIFIVIFINAITRRKYIGILKGIGIKSSVIEYAYIFQSVFYAFCGTAIGMLLVFLLIKPYFAAHPINFPFSDGILVATLGGTLSRGMLLFVATLIAGFIPARIVVKQNTLDAILGR